MTIPAGDNWCPECEEACHDHATICTVCGTTLTAPPPAAARSNRQNDASVRVVPEHLTQEIRSAAQELRGLLRHAGAQIAQVGQEQDLLHQQLAAAAEQWQVTPAELLDPQGNHQQASSQRRPTSQKVLNEIPRVTLTPNSPIFHQSTIEWWKRNTSTQNTNHSLIGNETATKIQTRAIPGDFGATRNDRLLVIGPSFLVLANPLTGKGQRLSEETLSTIQRHRAARSRVILYMQRGDGLTFVEKGALAERSGASACIIGNHVTEPWPYTMQDSKNQAAAMNLSIPVVMVSKEDGQQMLENLHQEQRHDDNTNDAAIECTLTIQKDDTAVPDCSICTDAFVVGGDSVMTLPSCGHTFHTRCATTWLTQHNTCPYCRAELPLEDPDQERERRRNATSAATRESSSLAFYG